MLPVPGLGKNYTLLYNMEIKGRIIHVLPAQSGVSKSGSAWKKQEYVLETEDQYPRKVCFGFFGDRVDQYPAAIGDDVIVSFDIDSREFNGRWYTNIQAWKLEKVAASAPNDIPPVPNDLPPFDAAPSDFTAASSTDDLPF